MALNLNKNEDNNHKSTSENKGLNLNKSDNSSSIEKKGLNLNKSNEVFETSEVNKSKDEKSVESENVNKDLVSDKSNNTLVEDESTGKRKSPLVLLSLSILIIGVLIYFFNSEKENLNSGKLIKENPKKSSIESNNPKKKTGNKNISDSIINSIPEINVSNEIEENKSTGTKVSITNVGNSQFQESIEDKAKKVLAGEYGNGIERKNALGDEYNTIQSKVNELYQIKY